VRDLFGYTKVITMPAIVNHANQCNGAYDLAAPLLNISKDSSVELSSSLVNEIVKDPNQQNRVVDNVMQFFRYKENASFDK